ncbi:MAG: hypothetical protein NC218_08125 [Acetobacter sp.]|nr:hypothetical protein [Acetobacter sp.]
MYNNLPKMLRLAMLLVKAMDIKNAIEVINSMVYLWREFGIKIKITPIIQKYKISFYYKDERLAGTDTTDLKDIKKLINDISQMRCE